MDQLTMLNAIIKLRALQLYYHYCHNLTYGATFISDHGMFGDFYSAVEGHYDSMAEYTVAMLGNSTLDTKAINTLVSEKLNQLKIENMNAEEMFAVGLNLEKELYSDLEEVDSKGPIGLKNLVGDISQASDVRMYKIQQRLK